MLSRMIPAILSPLSVRRGREGKEIENGVLEITEFRRKWLTYLNLKYTHAHGVGTISSLVSKGVNYVSYHKGP